MKKKLSKTTKISIGLFSILSVAGLLGTGAYFWVQYQNNKKNSIRDSSDNELKPNVSPKPNEAQKPSNKPEPPTSVVKPPENNEVSKDPTTNYLIPFEFPEYIDDQKIMENYVTKRERFFLDKVINKKEILHHIVNYENYVNTLDKQKLSFNEQKIKENLQSIIMNSLLKSNACNSKLENIEIYYQLFNTKNINDLKYNQLNIYIKWKCQASDSFISKEYYDMLVLTLN